MSMRSFYSGEAEKIIGFFLSHKKEKVFVRDLSRRIFVDPSNTSKKLRELEKIGILKSEKKGAYKYYSLNTTSHLLPSFKYLFGALRNK